MRVVISHFYNEEYLLPWWLKHHVPMFDHGVLIDYASTDRSREICRQYAPNWEIIPSVNPKFEAAMVDLEVMNHEARFPEAWKIALNTTEFIHSADLSRLEQSIEEAAGDGARLPAAIMIDGAPDVVPSQERSLVAQKNWGVWENEVDFQQLGIPGHSQPCRSRLYHRYKIGAYHVGRHGSDLPRILYADRRIAATLWYGFSPWTSAFLDRKTQIAAKLAVFDKERGWGVQHNQIRSELEAIHARARRNAGPLFADPPERTQATEVASVTSDPLGARLAIVEGELAIARAARLQFIAMMDGFQKEAVRAEERIEGQLAEAKALSPYLASGLAHTETLHPLFSEHAGLAGVLANNALERNRLNADIASLHQTLSERNDEVAQAQSEIASLQAQISAGQETLHRTLSEKIDEVAQAQSEITSLRAQVTAAQETLRRALSEKNDEVAQAQSEISALQAQITAGQETLRHTNLTLDQLKDIAQAREAALVEIKDRARTVSIRRSVLNDLHSAKQRMPYLGAAPAFDISVLRAQLRRSAGLSLQTRPLSWLERRSFERHMVFDREFYLWQNPDVAELGIDPLTHYLSHGLREDRDPNPAFSAVWYRMQAPEPIGELPAYAHFLADTARRGWPQHPLFDAEYYTTMHPDLQFDRVDAYDHFLTTGAHERRDPHPLVKMAHLAAQAGLETSVNPLMDYLRHPHLHRATPHPLFNSGFYLAENSDVAAGQTNPLLHYTSVGWRAGRWPHPLFASDWYLAANPDVLAAGMEPFGHYLRFGADEGRKPHPLFDPEEYLAKNTHISTERRDAFAHYVSSHAKETLETTGTLPVKTMVSVTPEQQRNSHDPITAFLRHGPDEITI